MLIFIDFRAFSIIFLLEEENLSSVAENEKSRFVAFGHPSEKKNSSSRNSQNVNDRPNFLMEPEPKHKCIQYTFLMHNVLFVIVEINQDSTFLC